MGTAGENLGNGLAKAVEIAEGEAESAPPQSEQLPLLPSDQLDTLPAEKMARQLALQRTGPGRPAGALNRKTTQWRDYLLTRYTSPLIGLAEIANRRAIDLATELGCKPIEALAIQVKCKAELAPYLHGKMPVDVVLHHDLPTLRMANPEEVLAFYRAMEGSGEAGGLPDLSQLKPILENMENQTLSPGQNDRVGMPELEDTANVEEYQGVEE